ncbi:tRNA-5-carboxymethylaminomethyl-2-thiouridine(34) synthesis protein MnmE [Candidatus Syntrophocurvum alkaliphilum]|uniref:tRNA modification GTPase MnmE n=1 Tax=Candidatus Syntrophocurvum alkaliphilum TaxID=2293317 RepID=A0A6I6DI92_9FIRM|nr:tRNA uridine-5-carboxymethylaminomethyl(34) synthesis GTPase MnmE [Candidatus Syntrophocurvum alkaliphilum]QGU00614.1 tRNA-5-carboxymethylaminomethyl-2-thiouridine(34) synthesis protein MnmE [Candidatus Syntrophocurvum alkaliphilum]
MIEDRIVAISTPPGEGGIAIIRLSGDGVIESIDNMFLPYKKGVSLKNKNGYTLTYGWILDENGEKIDEVLVSIMRSPKSYTAEDMVEINCHGGNMPARRCIERILKSEKNIRLSEPGEFTKRAFLNGRLDISQAEGIIEIIRSKTSKSLNLAVKQLEGKTSQYINKIEDELIRLNAMVEASIDFPDEVGGLDYNEVNQILESVDFTLNKLINASERSQIYRDGISVAISGKPNVGKSSLLNALIRKERAIVTSIPGTTRDVLEEYINVRGIPVKLVDTAGIRETHDVVEEIGVKKSKEVIDESDLVLFILDFETGITDEDLEIYNLIKDKNTIILVNKEDLEKRNITENEIAKLFKDLKIIRGSVKEDIGLDELESTIEEMILGDSLNSDDLELMINLRQKNSLIKAQEYISNIKYTVNEVSLDCLGVDVWGALDSLGEITGKSLKEDVIDRIFRDFCIGK